MILLKYNSFIGYECSGIPEAAIIGSAPNQPWVKACLDWYKDRTFINSKGKFNEIVVPMIIKSKYESFYGMKMQDDGNIKVWSNNIILPYKFLSPKNGFTKKIDINENTYTIHHFEASWIDKKIKKSFNYKKVVHMFLQRFLGIKMYSNLLYFIRTNITKA